METNRKGFISLEGLLLLPVLLVLFAVHLEIIANWKRIISTVPGILCFGALGRTLGKPLEPVEVQGLQNLRKRYDGRVQYEGLNCDPKTHR